MIERTEGYEKKNEKTLLVLSSVSLLVAMVLFLVLLTREPSNVCSSPQCVSASNHILETIDTAVDPCQDFYAFTCGTFTKLPLYESWIHRLQYVFQNQLRSIVSEPLKRSEADSLKTMKNWYRTCLIPSTENSNNSEFLKVLNEIGGWPMVQKNFNESDFDWKKAMIKARQLGLDFEFFLKIEFRTVPSNSIKVTPAEEPLLLQNHLTEPGKILKIVQEFAPAVPVPELDIPRTIAFARQLSLLFQRYHNLSSEEEPTKTAINQIDYKYINVPWLAFFNSLINGTVPVLGTDPVYFIGDYYKDLHFLLLQTPKRIQANYISLHLLLKNYWTLSEKVQVLLGSSTQQINKRKEHCYKKSKELFPDVAEAEYVRRFAPFESTAYVKEIASRVRYHYKNLIDGTDLFQPETKKLVLQKLDDIEEVIGWRQLVYNQEKFDQVLLENQTFNFNMSLFTLTRKINFFNLKKRFSKYQSDIDLVLPKLELNAYYLPEFNQLVLPAPILQGFIFDARRPRYLNYGTVGSYIAHELTHGLRSVFLGQEYFDEDFLKSNASFAKILDCLIEQYEQYHENGNGSETVEENLADSMAPNIAYLAYQKYVEEYGTEEYLPGLDLTPNQLFWIMSGSHFCRNNDELTKGSTTYPSPSYRIIGSLRNSPYFAKDFNCAVGTEMNPIEKCRVLL